MNLFEQSFISDQINNILSFYDKRVINNQGGYFQNFNDDGELFSSAVKHIYSSCQLVASYSCAASYFDNSDYRQFVSHGIDYIEKYHWQSDVQKYAICMHDNHAVDLTTKAQAYAWLLIGYSAALKAKILNHDALIIKVFNLLERDFWLSDIGLYAEELGVDNVLTDYRGQSANMHICQALISVYEATQDEFFLQRAKTVAYNVTVNYASDTKGLIWDHYCKTYQVDWLYNRDDPHNTKRPWGFQSGHQVQWAKILLQLHRYNSDSWLLEKAKLLFDITFDVAWDENNGGMFSSFDPSYECHSTNKYFWVQAESIAASALLFQFTDDANYLEIYTKLWQYCLEYMIDSEHGAWFSEAKFENSPCENEKASAGIKSDYENMAACFEVLKVLGWFDIDMLVNQTVSYQNF